MKRTVVTLTINAGLRVTGNMPTCILSTAYSATVQAFGGSGGGFVFTADPSQSLPSGLTGTDNNDGTYTVAGTTAVPGPVHVFGVLTDSDRNQVPYSFNFLVQALPLTISGHIAGGVGGAAASGSYSSSGGVGSKTFTVVAGTFPTTGGLSSAGAATGNWSAPGSYSWTVRVTDSASPTPSTADLADSCTISYATLAYSSGALANIYDVGDAGSTAGAVTFTGGSGTLVAATTASGSLPPGCSASYSGMTWVLSGTATTYGTYTFVPRVQSSDGQFANGPSQTVVVGDLLWSSGISLLHFDGTAGATSITDEHGLTWTLNTAGSPTTALSSTQKVFGATSLYFNNGGYTMPRTPFNFGTGAFTIAARLRPDDTGVSRDFLAHRNSAIGSDFWGCRRNSSDGIQFFAILGGSTVCNVSTPNSVITGSTAWNAVEIRRNATSGAIEISVDGVLQTLSGTNFANNTVAMPYPNCDVVLGQGDNTIPGSWLGYIDEFQVLSVRRHTGSSYTVETRAFQNGGI